MDAPSELLLAHLNLDVHDLERSERFYREVLSLPVATPRPTARKVCWPGGLLVLEEGSPVSGGTLHFGLRVPSIADVEAWFVRFRALDVPIVSEPGPRGDVYVGRISDPDGYPIEIYTDTPDAA